MKHRSHIIRAGLVFLLAVFSGCQSLNLNPPGPVLGQVPPSFHIKDLKGTYQSPKQYRGKPLVIMFWSKDDVVSRAEIQPVLSVYEAFSPRGVSFLSISLDKDTVDLKNFVYQEAVPFPVICDRKSWDGLAAKNYRVTSTPRYFLVHPSGDLIFMADWIKEIEAELQKLLS